uniref:hypothetical protein n=1 Tax=Thauera sp. SDU_THAU2 TaxID=3136633 RepID=UPI00311EDEC3
MTEPLPLTTLNTPGGEPGLANELREPQGADRGHLARLGDDGAAGRKGGGHLPDQGLEGKVPRRDRRDDADWLLQRHAEDALVIGSHRAGAAGDLRRPAGEILQDLDRLADVDCVGLLAKLAGVDCLQESKLLLMLDQEVGELEDQPLPVQRTEPAPVALERRACRTHGLIDHFGTGFERLGDYAAGTWLVNVDRLAGGDGFVGDPMGDRPRR